MSLAPPNELNSDNLDTADNLALLRNPRSTETERIVQVPFEKRLDLTPEDVDIGRVIKVARVELRKTDPAADISPDSDPAERVVKAIFDSLGIIISKEDAKTHVQHNLDFPEIPTEGFTTVENYQKYTLQMNKFLASQRANYNQDPEKYHPEDPERPGKKMCKVTFTCADGRICPTNFLKRSQTTKRYATRWQPHAGLVMFPEIVNGLNSQELKNLLQTNTQLKETVLNRLDTSLTDKVESFFKKKKHSNNFERLHFEFQSHCQLKGFPAHGCGAHKNNFDEAQSETIKDAMLVDMWLKERYRDQYDKGWFRIYRTVHDTGPGGNIYSASKLENEPDKIHKEYLEKHKQLFKEAETLYSAPKIDGLADGVFQEYKENYVGNNEEHHDEQAIRIGDTHFAHTLLGQSVLEISWTDSPKNLYDHILVLLEIIEGNFRKKWKEKPAILHFDIPQGRPDIVKVFEQTKDLICQNDDLKKRLDEGSLKIISTETNVHTYVTKLN